MTFWNSQVLLVKYQHDLQPQNFPWNEWLLLEQSQLEARYAVMTEYRNKSTILSIWDIAYSKTFSNYHLFLGIQQYIFIRHLLNQYYLMVGSESWTTGRGDERSLILSDMCFMRTVRYTPSHITMPKPNQKNQPRGKRSLGRP